MTDTTSSCRRSFLFYLSEGWPTLTEEDANVLHRYLLVHYASRTWLDVIRSQAAGLGVAAVAVSIALVFTFVRRGSRLVSGAVAAAVLLSVGMSLPGGGANHFYLESLCLLVTVACSPPVRFDREVMTALLRWIPTIVMFYGGLKKALFGTYFGGEFLAYQMRRPAYEAALGALLPDEEFSRIMAVVHADGIGPYRFDSWPALVVSNSIYLAEIGTAVLLLIPRTRRIGAWLGIAIVLGIEFVAREVFFGLLVLNLLTLFLQPRAFRFVAYTSMGIAGGLVPLQLLLGRDTWLFN